MNTNKKDVNDYFKWIRRYYMELLKKKKKDSDEKKQKVRDENLRNKKKVVNIVHLKVKNTKKNSENELDMPKLSQNMDEMTLNQMDSPTLKDNKIEKSLKKDIEKRKKVKEKKKKKQEEINIIRNMHQKEFDKLKLEQEKSVQNENLKKIALEEKRNKDELEQKKKLETEKLNKEKLDKEKKKIIKNNKLNEKEKQSIAKSTNLKELNSINKKLKDNAAKKMQEKQKEKRIKEKETNKNKKMNQPNVDIKNAKNIKINNMVGLDKEKKDEKKEDKTTIKKEPDKKTNEIKNTEKKNDEKSNSEKKVEAIKKDEKQSKEHVQKPKGIKDLDNNSKKKKETLDKNEKNVQKPKGIEEKQKDSDKDNKKKETLDKNKEKIQKTKGIEEKQKDLDKNEKKKKNLDKSKEKIQKSKGIEDNKKDVDKDNKKKKETDANKEYYNLGKEEFIKTLHKRIKDDYDSLHNLNMENHRISLELENCRDISDVNKLLDRIHNNQKDINSILDRIDGIQNGNIIKHVYGFSKTQPRFLKDYIKELEKEPNNYFYIKNLYEPYFKEKLDYIETIKRIKNDTSNKEKETQDKKNGYERLDNKQDENDIKLEKYNKRRYYFESLLLKYQISINSLKDSVKKISIVEQVTKKFFLGNIEIKSNIQLQSIAMRMAMNPQNNKSPQEIYNELKSRLVMVASSKLVPSNNYKTQLLKEKEKLFNTGKELGMTLKEIKAFKEEFKDEFGDYYDNDEYFSYLANIEKIESKLKNEQDKLHIIDNTIDKTIIENDRRVDEINKLNIGRNNTQVIQNGNQNNQNNMNNTMAGNNQQIQNTQNNVQYQNNNQYMNNYYNQMYGQNSYYEDEYEYENEHRRGGRSR